MSNFSTYLPKKGLKLNCPECGQKKCFRQYHYTDSGLPIHPSVGICDHVNSCGYHYPPKQYFIDNPDRKTKDWTPPKWTAPKLPSPPKPIGFIPVEYVTKSESLNNHFIDYLFSFFGKDNQKVIDVCKMYRVGSTKKREVIYWQIDTKGNVRTGKIMQYNPETGKRIHKEPDLPDWVHSKMKYRKQLPEDFNLQQCYFGTHLINQFPDKTVAIVEGEKTAILCSLLMPDKIWLASGGLQQISVEKSKIFAGRKVVFFPDLGKTDKKTPFELWTSKAIEISKQVNCKISVSDLLERKATDEDRINGLDIADFMLMRMQPPKPQKQPTRQAESNEAQQAPQAETKPPQPPMQELEAIALQTVGLQNNLPKDRIINLMAVMKSISAEQAGGLFGEMINQQILENCIDERYYINQKGNSPF